MIIGHFHQDVEALDRPGFGFVEEAISPISPGRVHYMGTSWPAQFACSAVSNTIQPGERVMVVGHLGAIMLVAPLSNFSYCPKKNKKCPKECVVRLNEMELKPTSL